jgi:hypothetical protein
MAISVALAENPHCEIEVVGLENDLEIMKKIPEVNPPIPYYKNYKKIQPIPLKQTPPGSGGFSDGMVRVKVLLGDARETVKQLPADYFDAVFYDPFSPKTMPEMWSIELFQEMERVMKSSAILATYSCARSVRENMSKAGLLYDEGPIVGRRGPGTIAGKWG